jgi:carboxypeptidase A
LRNVFFRAFSDGKNLTRVYDNEMQQNLRNSRSEFNWNSYWQLNQIYEFIEATHLSHPADTEIFQYGTSFEGRPLEGIKVNIGGGSGKKAVVIEGLMHAREWISGATVTWMLNQLLSGSDPTIDDVARRYVWYFLPVTNPDGYAFTWSSNRNWRKTRRPSSGICWGSDPNRNWDNHFAQGGTSTNPCSDTYPGPSPFSEPETLALSNYLSTIPNLVGYLSFHAYGHMLMTPPVCTTLV